MILPFGLGALFEIEFGNIKYIQEDNLKQHSGRNRKREKIDKIF
jgi:hypothetical protein